VEALRDVGGFGWNVGSGWLIRKQAIKDIGGFDGKCLLEDVYSSMQMMSKGWTTVFVTEALQWGLVPESFEAHVNQFTRWVRSTLI
jgi:cellulose synthase/poly-beta-1,6-N-acetylglucosamine synthase-like glycosyltransferase